MIRPADIADLQKMLRIAELSQGLPHWPTAIYRSLFENQPASIRRTTLVAELIGEVVAFGVLATLTAISPVESEIENLAVDPSQRRRGIGGSVLAALLENARESGEGLIRLEVRSSNAGALALYSRAGFRESGRRSSYYHAPVEDAVLMECAVAPGTSDHLVGSGIMSFTYGS